MIDIAATIREALDTGLNLQALDLARSASSGDAKSAEIPYLGALASARMGADRRSGKVAGEDRPRSARQQSARRRGVEPGRQDRQGTIRRGTRQVERGRTRISRARPSRTTAMRLRHRRRRLPRRQRRHDGDARGRHAAARSGSRSRRSAAPGAGGRSLAPRHRRRGAARPRSHRRGPRPLRRSVSAGGHRFGDIASMRRQLLLIGTAAARELAEVLPAPQVIAFSGHMIDHPARPSPRFPARLEAQVAAALRERVASLGPSIGYAQAACGADILFLEAMQDAGMQTQVVLPFPVADFIRSSVSFAGDAWIARFERVVAARDARRPRDRGRLPRRRRAVRACGKPDPGHGVPARAGTVDASADADRARTRCDPNSSAAPRRRRATGRAREAGSTTSTSPRCAAAHRNRPAAPQANARDAGHGKPVRSGRLLQSLLFADVSGFSTDARAVRAPIRGTVPGDLQARSSIRSPHRAVHANTHGDGLFLVFDLPSHAAEFAVRLQQEIGRFDWPALGLAPETGVRIALHTGPLFRIFDPVTARHTFYGTHVNRTARLEPVVQPRQHLRDRGVRGVAGRRGPGSLCLRLHRHDAARQAVRRRAPVPAAM